jgi:hypothetical protein
VQAIGCTRTHASPWCAVLGRRARYISGEGVCDVVVCVFDSVLCCTRERCMCVCTCVSLRVLVLMPGCRGHVQVRWTHRCARCCLWTPGGHPTQPGMSWCLRFSFICMHRHACTRVWCGMHVCHCTSQPTPKHTQYRCYSMCERGGAILYTLGCFGRRQTLQFECARGSAMLILSLASKLRETFSDQVRLHPCIFWPFYPISFVIAVKIESMCVLCISNVVLTEYMYIES